MGRVDPNQPSPGDDPNDEVAARRRLNEQHAVQRDHRSPRSTPQTPPLPTGARPPGGGTRVANPLVVGFDSDRFETDLDTDDAEEPESQGSAAALSHDGAEASRSVIANTAAATITARPVAASSSSPDPNVAATLPTSAKRRRQVQLLPVRTIVTMALVIATVAVLYGTGKISFSGGAPGHALTTPGRAQRTPPAVSAATPAAHHPLLAALHIQSTIQTAGQLVHTSAVKAEAARREQAHRHALARARRHRKELARRRAQARHHTTAAASIPASATTYAPSTSTSAAPTATSATTTPTYTPTTPSYTPPAQTPASATSASSSQPAGPTGAGTQSGGCDPLCK